MDTEIGLSSIYDHDLKNKFFCYTISWEFPGAIM